jgi:hypothetical protein
MMASLRGCEVGSRGVFSQNSENKCQVVIEEAATTQAKEETASSLSSVDVRAVATLENVTRTN